MTNNRVTDLRPALAPDYMHSLLKSNAVHFTIDLTQQFGIVLQNRRHISMIGAQCRFPDGHRAGVQRLSPSIIAILMIKPTKIVQTFSNFGMLGTERFFSNTQSLSMQRFGLMKLLSVCK